MLNSIGIIEEERYWCRRRRRRRRKWWWSEWMLILFVLAALFRQRERAPESLFKSIRVKRRREKLMKLHSRRCATANERKASLVDWIRKSKDIRRREREKKSFDQIESMLLLTSKRKCSSTWSKFEMNEDDEYTNTRIYLNRWRRREDIMSLAMIFASLSLLTHQWRFSSVSIRIAMTPARYRYMGK